MLRSYRSLATTALAAVSLASCADNPAGTPPAARTPAEPVAVTRLDPIFERAAADFGVPASLLKSIGYVETRWQMVRGEVEFEGVDPAFGVMALRGERLARGAALADVQPEAARVQPEANIRAAAALLRSYADELRLDRSDLGAWAPAVARYSGIEAGAGQAAYVHSDVYAALARGAIAKDEFGQAIVTMMPVQVEPRFPAPAADEHVMSFAPDYGPAVWRPSPNFNDRPAGDVGKVQMVIIHTCEGSYTSCWSWLTNSQAGTSAHYVVREDGGEISQLVYESKRAWHIGATYQCSNNSNQKCSLNGYSSNHFTIGIEHGGYASQSSFPTAQIDASAKLSCNISKKYGIPRDRYHYVAHGQLQPYNRTDPGPNWPWTDYMNRINAHCGAGTIIVDSNNNNNNTAQGYIQLSGNWTSTTATPGYYGSGYFHAPTQAVSDPATFWFYLPAAATKTVDAWWTAGSNRSATAPFIAWNAGGTRLGTVNVNQQLNGGKWNTIGSFSFSAGWNRIQLSRWTAEGYVVIADAVRIR
jgi:N-acetyl-anhydromuramyl-L-alanine amidase AmpD